VASSAGTTRRDDGAAGRQLSVVRPPEPMEQLAGVLSELLTWLRSRNPQPAAPDPVELLHSRFLMLDPPEPSEVTREKMEATLTRLRLKAGRMQLQDLQAVGITVRLEGEQLLVSPARLVTPEVREKLERWRESVFAALRATEPPLGARVSSCDAPRGDGEPPDLGRPKC
jgi:hypothetical protein